MFPTGWFPHFGHQILLQGDSITSDGHDQTFSKHYINIPKAIYLQYLKKEVGDGVHFLYVNEHQRLYRLVLSF